MKQVVFLVLVLGTVYGSYAQYIARYREGLYDGTYIHGVDNLGNPAQSGDISYRELPPNITEGVYTWWNYSNSVGQPSNSYGTAIGFGKGVGGSAEIWAGWTNGRLYTRFLRNCCQGWSEWNQIWTSNTDGSGSGLDADTVDGLQPVLVQNSGNVGIGTSSPDSRLAVNGNIHAKEVKVDLTGWPDYVFKEGYDLPTLAEVERHIKEKGHLISIPSAKEVEENGIELGKMNKLLLEKIEELTLYTLNQEKQLEKQQNQIDELKKIINGISENSKNR